MNKDKAIRITALRIATDAALKSTSASTIVTIAAQYENYIKNGKKK